MEKKVTFEHIGKADGYEHYHNRYFFEGKRVTESSYDTNQKLHIISTLYGVKLRRNWYAGSPEGMARKIEKDLTTEPDFTK